MRFHRGAVKLRTPDTSGPAVNGTGDHPEHVADSIEEIIHLETRDRKEMGFSDHLASKITAFSGSMLYVWLHVAWFGVWILLNVAYFLFEPFDPYPFGLLTMVVSLEAIFLSTFVLIAQNHQAIVADRRAKVDLQVDMIAEREVTKLIKLVSHIHEHLGIDQPKHDHELEEMKKPMHVERVADAIDAAEQDVDPEKAGGPESAADTEV
jgi:uncharacterized membrane protein